MTSLERKDSHLSICLNKPVDLSQEDLSGFSRYRFDHDALPEINKEEISLNIKLFGKDLRAPIIIGAMTGGTEKAAEINRRLALACESCQVGFALGSQRKILENPQTLKSFDVRKPAPRLPLLFGNLGAVQLNYGVRLPQIIELVSAVSCDAFIFHLNPLQEWIQPEGNCDFKGLVQTLQQIVPQIPVPVLVKEVGAGISETTAYKLKEIGLAGVEVAGLGGTSWARVEGLRSQDPIYQSLGETFSRWGIPTAESIQICKKILSQHAIIASGGIRNGIDVAKAIALGADAVALALPFLKAAEESVESVVQAIQKLSVELKTVMFLTGSRNIAELAKKPLRFI